MDQAKKNLALLILGKAKKKPDAGAAPVAPAPEGGGESEGGDDEGAEDAGMASAMDDFIAAVHAKDSAAAVAAFKSLYEMC